MARCEIDELDKHEHVAGHDALQRRAFLKLGIAAAGAVDVSAGLNPIAAPAPFTDRAQSSGPVPAPLDAAMEAKKIAFDRIGNGEKILLISGFPQTRMSWNRLIPLLSPKFQMIPADLPSFGDSGILSAPATTENVARVFHEFVAANLGTPLRVVAHDFGAWCAYSWALLFPDDFKSLTLIEAGIPGVTLTNDIELSDYKRKWNFIFMMLPDLPAEIVKGHEDEYVGWWFKNKVYKPGAIPPSDVGKYVLAYARDGRMDAAFDYCRNILVDMDFNKRQFKKKLPMRLLAVGGAQSIPTMGDSLRPYFEQITSVVIPESGHFVPEEQPQALAKALLAFL
jgi:pimeloyl-ACP methyl ester carboxylesterase